MGTVSLDGNICTKDLMKQTTAYVLQADRLLHTLTVRETLTYAAFLRLPADTTQKQRDLKVCLEPYFFKQRFCSVKLGGLAIVINSDLL